jgi:vacuolar protein sorting-associated protein 45
MSSTDLVAILRSYLERSLREVPGMKVLLLDTETIRSVSTALSQSDILEQEVYLVQRIDSEEKREHLPHLKAIAFLRPTRENIARLRRELKEPCFGAYHLYFTNRVEDMRLQDLAEGDVKELVACVHEAFGDFIALESHHAAVPLPRPHLALAPMAWDYGASSDMISRLTEGIASIVLCLRKRFSIKYQRGSEISQRVAQSLHHLAAVEQRELFDFGSRNTGESAPLLLILDRKDDPVTPLLSQWTYQAMLHEILGSRDNRVSLRHVVGLRPELAEAVLSPLQDAFYAKNMYANFGDVGMAIKSLVDAVSAEGRQARDFQSLDDMASFVENLPEMSHQQGVTAKHVALMTELSHAVERRALMKVSGVEQDIACAAANLGSHYDAVSELVRSGVVASRDKLRLIALFALRYERDGRGQISALMTAAAEGGVDPAQLSAVRSLLKHCGTNSSSGVEDVSGTSSGDVRISDLFSDRSFSSRFATLAKQHIRGVENVYTQHVPPLISILERAAKGKLADTDYLPVDGSSFSTSGGGGSSLMMTMTNGGGGGGGLGSTSGSSVPGNASLKPPKLIVVFIVGGTTYEEAKAVAELNSSADRGEGWAAGMRFILAGTGPQSSSTFLEDWEEVSVMERYQKTHQGQGGMR